MLIINEEQFKKLSNPKSGKIKSVHSGAQHLDEILAVTLYEYFNFRKKLGEIFVVRTRNKEILAALGEENCFDVGFGKFDHHQDNVPYYENGVKYAACGLVLKDMFEKGLVEDYEYEYLLEHALYGVQANDNGQNIKDQFQNPFQFLSYYNATWEQGGANDYKKQAKLFLEASHMAKKVLVRMLDVAKAQKNGIEVVQKAIAEAKDGVMELPCYIDGWHEQVIEHNEKYIWKNLIVICVYGCGGDEWASQVIRMKIDGFSSWTDNDKEYCALLPGFVFVHNSGFIAKFKSHESAMLAAQKAAMAWKK